MSALERAFAVRGLFRVVASPPAILVLAAVLAPLCAAADAEQGCDQACDQAKPPADAAEAVSELSCGQGARGTGAAEAVSVPGADEATPQSSESQADPAPGSPSLYEEYLVRVGDTIQMSVWGEPTLTGEAVVMLDGTVSLPLIGRTRIVGKTVPAATEAVKQAYLRYLRDPKISLSCIPGSPLQVYIEGSVNRPGPVAYDPRLRWSDYLAQVGGPSPNADLSSVVITSVRGSQVGTTKVDLSGASPEGNPADSLVLRPGDTVWIGRALPVAVVGAVRSPGSFDYRRDLRLSDYIGLAGGPTERADLKKGQLKHTANGESITGEVDLAAALRDPDTADVNPLLAPGDVVTVPEKFLAGGIDWSDILRAVTSVVIFWDRW